MKRFPTCAVCNKEVDDVIRRDGPLTIQFVARCHGKEDVVDLSHLNLVIPDLDSFDWGIAFSSEIKAIT